MLVHNRLTGHFEMPLEQGWQFGSDLRMLPVWHVGVVAVRDVTGKATELGTKAITTLKLFDGPHDFETEVVAVEPLKLTTQTGQQLDGSMRYTTTIHYEPAAAGYDCVWEQETEIPDDLPGPMGSQVFVERYMEQMLRQSVENLKLLMELMVPQPA